MTEIKCEIVPYTECQMTMEATPYKSYDMVPLVYKKKVCSEGMDTVQHTKMMPECRNVTKQNCITKWEEDENGNQVSRKFDYKRQTDDLVSLAILTLTVFPIKEVREIEITRREAKSSGFPGLQ